MSIFKPVLAAPPAVHSSLGNDNHALTTTGGVSYHLDDFDYPEDSLNNFIACRGTWSEPTQGGTVSEKPVHLFLPMIDRLGCIDNNPSSVSFDKVTRYGDSGYSLKLSYNVQQTNSLVSYYEHLFNNDTFYDLSSFDSFNFMVKGEGGTIGSGATFYIRFADKDWNMEYVTITGISGEWEQKSVNISSLNTLDRKQMREMTIIFENNRGNSGRYASPLSGTLYFDSLIFVDENAETGSDDQFLDLLERRTFQYFWEYADPKTGLIRERATDSNLSSIATVGFGLTAICVAPERGWITTSEAYTRVLTTLNSFYCGFAKLNHMH